VDRRVSGSDGPFKALIFDLDGTLIDSVYAHVFAWQRALDEVGLLIVGWRIHRRIGMNGGLFARAVVQEVGREAAFFARLRVRIGRVMADNAKKLPSSRSAPGLERSRRSRRGQRQVRAVQSDVARRVGLRSIVESETSK
jgi:beta-phosphoglucomutase-like phosphatase (HAD superfamily)